MEPYIIHDWDNIKIDTLKHQQIKEWEIYHPYAQDNEDLDISRKIKVQVTGETYNGVPHGLGYVQFVYNGELHINPDEY